MLVTDLCCATLQEEEKREEHEAVMEAGTQGAKGGSRDGDRWRGRAGILDRKGQFMASELKKEGTSSPNVWQLGPKLSPPQSLARCCDSLLAERHSLLQLLAKRLFHTDGVDYWGWLMQSLSEWPVAPGRQEPQWKGMSIPTYLFPLLLDWEKSCTGSWWCREDWR